MISYTLPGFTSSLPFNLFFARLLREHPELAREGVVIDSIYSNFPGCPLNGGRTQVRGHSTKSQIERTFEALRELGLTARLTLTNMYAQPVHLEDEYTQKILRLADSYGAEAIVYADVVNDFLKRSYPSMTRTLSTTYDIRDVDTLNEKLREYDYVVLNYTLHRDEDFLRAVEHPERLEVMVNELCSPTCSRREAHYRHISRCQVEGKAEPFPCDHVPSPALIDQLMNHHAGHPVILTNEDVRRLHDEFGISRFKMVGRGIPYELTLESYLYYLVADEARDEVLALAKRELPQLFK